MADLDCADEGFMSSAALIGTAFVGSGLAVVAAVGGRGGRLAVLGVALTLALIGGLSILWIDRY